MAEAPLPRPHALDGRLPIREPEREDFGGDVPQPRIGDAIMVMRQPWLDYILDGKKTMELRGRKRRLGFIWLGMGGTIYGRAKIVGAVNLNEEEFRARESEHCWPGSDAIPYNGKPCGLMLQEVTKLPLPIPYWRPPCAIGWNVYRTSAEDLPMKTRSTKGTTKRKTQDHGTGNEDESTLPGEAMGTGAAADEDP